MIGIVDVGGGVRGIYGAGVLDYCLDQNINFDLFIGVSAGSANGASFLANQRGRNYKFYTEYSLRKEYMSISNFIYKKSYLDLNYVYSTLTNDDGEYPLDYDSFSNNPCQYYAVASRECDNKAIYFTKKDISRNNYDVFKASSCVPIACKPYIINDISYFDGGLSDPIPFKKAFEMGCDKVIVILTRPKNYVRVDKTDKRLSLLLRNKYPITAKALKNRASLYNKLLSEAINLEKEGKLLIIAPDDIGNLGTFNKDKEELDKLYKKGYNNAKIIQDFIK